MLTINKICDKINIIKYINGKTFYPTAKKGSAASRTAPIITFIGKIKTFIGKTFFGVKPAKGEP